MSLFIVGFVSGYLAFIIGKWRHSCIFWEVKEPYNLPLAWHKPAVRVGTWLAVTIFSLVFASAIAYIIAEEINSLLGMFSWGALLDLRWHASLFEAHRQALPVLKEMEERFGRKSE